MHHSFNHSLKDKLWVKYPFDFETLATDVNVIICQEVAGHTFCQDSREDLPFHIQMSNASELADIMGVFFLWNESSDCVILCWWNGFGFPDDAIHFHNSFKTRRQFL